MDKELRRIAAVYDYRDDAGGLLYQVVRYEPKTFRQRRPDGPGRWSWDLAHVRRVLYRLPELRAAMNSRVYFCEGEKDVDTLISCGLSATTLAGGSNAPWRAEFAESLRGRSVVLLPDNDESGRRLMERVAVGLAGVAAEIRWLDLPGLPAKGDVSDWLSGRGTVAELNDLADAARPLGEPADDLLRLDAVEARPVRWLWKPWLPEGKLALIDGDPGQGKSFVTLDLAARLSRGEAWPDGQPGPGPTTTLLVTCEDGVEDTIVPRLDALAADRARVCSYRGRLRDGRPVGIPTLPDDLPDLERNICRSDARLVIIDPMMAFLGQSVNTISDQSVRSVLMPLAVMAERLGVTILFVRHLNKSNGKQAIYRGGGSIGIIASMRTAMLIARNPHDRDTRVLAMVKGNLGQEPQSLGFRLNPSPWVPGEVSVAWQGPVSLWANDLVGDVKDAINPRDWLAEQLAAGPRKATELIEQAGADGIGERTLTKAKAQLGVAAKRRDNAWWWLPPGQADFPTPSCLEPLEALDPPPPRRRQLTPEHCGPYAERR